MDARAYVVPVAAVLIVALLAAAFQVLTLNTSLPLAVAVGLIVVGVSRLFAQTGNPLVGAYLLGGGLVLYFLGDSLVESFGGLTIGDSLSFLGVEVG